jgi:hypothetical protein
MVGLEPETFLDGLNKLIDREQIPTGFVSEDPALTEMRHRKNLLRIYGFSNPIHQNAAVIFTAELLSKSIPDSAFFLPQTVNQLDPDHRFNDLVLAIQTDQALLAAA